MAKVPRLSRRTVLRGLGTALALPWLEAMTPRRAIGSEAAFPLRLAIVYVPNGIHMADWTPTAEGADYQLPGILEPLAAFKKDLLVLSGLAMHKADGPSGNHARAQAVFLTGQRPPDNGKELKLGISIDQLAAREIGRQTRLPSLELSCEAGVQSGRCDSPYSCAYTSNISWKSERMPLPPGVNFRCSTQLPAGLGKLGRLGDHCSSRMGYKRYLSME